MEHQCRNQFSLCHRGKLLLHKSDIRLLLHKSDIRLLLHETDIRSTRATASVPALRIFPHERVVLTYYLFLFADGPDTYMGSRRKLFPFPVHFCWVGVCSSKFRKDEHSWRSRRWIGTWYKAWVPCSLWSRRSMRLFVTVKWWNISVESIPLFATEESCCCASRTLEARAAASVPALHIFQHERVILTYYLFEFTDGPAQNSFEKLHWVTETCSAPGLETFVT